MGGFRVPPSVDAILAAVSSPDRLALLRLEHQLGADPPTDATGLPSLLAGLTHVTSRLHSRDANDAQGIRLLVDAALRLDVVKVCALSAEAAEAYSVFTKNLLSVDAAYVEVLLQRIVPTIFLSHVDTPGHEAACDLAHALVFASVETHHRRAVPLLIDALRAGYPHPVRPMADHVSYARALLRVARGGDHDSENDKDSHGSFKTLPLVVVRAVTAAVIEKLSAIEALADQEKTNAVLLELCLHIRSAFQQQQHYNPSLTSTPSERNELFVATHIDALFSANESLVVPVPTAKQTQYALLYAASLAGHDVTIALAERFRQAFYDPAVADRLRTHFLAHSAALIVRSRAVNTRDALRWVGRLATWLNSYVDAVERQAANDMETHYEIHYGDDSVMQQTLQPVGQQSNMKIRHHRLDCYRQHQSILTADVEVHHTFYSACAILMSLLARRKDVVSGRIRAPEIVARLRLRRILGCALAPLLVIPRDVIQQFGETVKEFAGLDVDQLLRNGDYRPVPTRTRSGARNTFEYTFGCPDVECERVRQILDDGMRWDGPLVKEKSEGNADGDAVDIEMTEVNGGEDNKNSIQSESHKQRNSTRKRVRFVEGGNMVTAPLPSSTCNRLLSSTMSLA